MANLNVDVKNIVLKIYGYFSVWTKIHKNLKDFHLFVEREYIDILLLVIYHFGHIFKKITFLESLEFLFLK